MEQKECSICKITKPLTDYYFRKDINKHRGDCKDCRAEKSKQFYQNNIESKRMKGRAAYALNPKADNERCKAYRKKNEVIHKERKKQYYQRNKETILEKRKDYVQNNKDKVKEWFILNKEYRIKYMSNLKKYRKENDELYKCICTIRANIYSAFKRKNFEKNTTTKKILGCDWETFKEYIEKQFQDGMTWQNYGINGWEYDHIIPIASAQNIEEVFKLNHYTNFQPLWSLENKEKGAKYIIEITA